VGDGMLRKPQLSQRLGQHDGRTDERAADDRRPACDEDRTWPAYSGCKDHGECRGKDQRDADRRPEGEDPCISAPSGSATYPADRS
jgi:hypothetical protein